MAELWHTTGEPNYSTPVIVIDKTDKITYFGYYGPRQIEPGERWSYMIDLINNTIKK